MGAGAADYARHQRHAQRRPRQDQGGGDEDDDLDQKNALHSQLSEVDERPRHDERQQRGPLDRHGRIVGRRTRQHTHDLAAGSLLRCADCGGDRLAVVLREHPNNPPNLFVVHLCPLQSTVIY